MALIKSVRQDNGVITTYHRIMHIQSAINSHTSIAVLSYIDKEGRSNEGTDHEPYKTAITYETDYIENITVQDAYQFLKTLPVFNDAEDDL